MKEDSLMILTSYKLLLLLVQLRFNYVHQRVSNCDLKGGFNLQFPFSRLYSS